LHKKWPSSAEGENSFSTIKQLSFPCLHTNAQSICNKFSELQSHVLQYSPKLVAITETWCNESVIDSEIHLDNYKLYRNDRKSGRGGGVLLYIHCSLFFTPCAALNEVGIEDSVWGTIELSDDKLLIGDHQTQAFVIMIT